MNPKLPNSLSKIHSSEKHFEDVIVRRALTFVVQLCPVLAEPLQSDSLTQKIQELIQCGTTTLIIVHLLLCALPGLAVQDAHFVLVTQLQISKSKNTISFNHSNDI